MRKKYSVSQTASAMGVMFEPVRFEIVSTIALMGTCRAVDVLEVFDLTQPTMSHHLNVLVENNVLTAYREGRCVYYSVNPYMMKAASDILISFGVPEEEKPAPKPSAKKPEAKKVPAKAAAKPAAKKESKQEAKSAPKKESKSKDKVKDKAKAKDKKEKSKKKKKK